MKPTRQVMPICNELPKRFASMICFLDSFLKKRALAPYSPILFGVNNEAVKEPKLCAKASLKVIFDILDAKIFHFKISKKQFKMLKNDKKRMILDEKTSFLISKL